MSDNGVKMDSNKMNEAMKNLVSFTALWVNRKEFPFMRAMTDKLNTLLHGDIHESEKSSNSTW